MNDSDRGPAPSYYDPPREIEQVPCGACDGTEKFGCTEKCKQPDFSDYCPKCGGSENCFHLDEARARYDDWEAWEPHCIENHRCPMKCKNGFIQ